VGRKRQSKQAREQTAEIETILSLPRLVRIGLVILPTFALVAIVQPIIDGIYLRYFFTMETRGAASLITAAIVLGYFLAGWLLIVGNIGEAPPQRRAVQIYLLVSIVVVLLAVFWIGYLFFTNLQLQV
jgi:hypothetical protein